MYKKAQELAECKSSCLERWSLFFSNSIYIQENYMIIYVHF